MNLPKYLANPYIHEIIISDENGNDVKKIQETFHDSRIKCFVNSTRLGGFGNKRVAVSHATHEWVCLMDSDNFAPVSYFEAWAHHFDPLDPSLVYCPSSTFRTSNHPGFNWKFLIGNRVNQHNFKEFWRSHGHNNNINVGNYIFHRDLFMKAEDVYNLKDECKCLDVQYQNYLLIQNGATLLTVDGMEYFHIVHDGSYYITECKSTNIGLFENMWLNGYP